MKSLFVAALYNFKLKGSLGRGIRLSETLFLTNDSKIIIPLLSPNFERIVGLSETNTLGKADSVIYGIKEHPSIDDMISDDAFNFLNSQLSLLQLFLMSLWLVKDNSVNFELGFLEHPHGNPYASSVASNFRAIRFCDASGKVSDCSFTATEVRIARDFFRLFEKNAVNLKGNDCGYLIPGDFTRFDRVLYFAQAARATKDLGLKIANYVTCFECLFCTESTELAHKLSERLAFFLSDKSEDRLKFFKRSKAAYSIRSKTVHGDIIKSTKMDEVKKLAENCDDMLRSVIRKILSSNSLHQKFIAHANELDKFLNDLVFGIEGASVYQIKT